MLRLRQDIPLFPGGRKKAFTLSSDDGVTQDGRLTALMRKYEIKGTFHLNSGLMGNRDWLIQPGIDVSHYKYTKEEAVDIYSGFEVAVHTVTHPDLTRVPPAMVSYEIAADKKKLEELVQHPVLGMSYPFGTFNNSVKQTAKNCGIFYSRTVMETNSFRLPDDFMEWNPTCHYCSESRMALAQAFLDSDTSAEYSAPLVFYVWGHAYQLDAYNDWDSLENFFKMIGGNDEIWYASNIEICSYMHAVKNLIYSSSGDYIFNPSSTDVWMQIDGQAYCIRSGETVTINWHHKNDAAKNS